MELLSILTEIADYDELALRMNAASGRFAEMPHNHRCSIADYLWGRLHGPTASTTTGRFIDQQTTLKFLRSLEGWNEE